MKKTVFSIVLGVVAVLGLSSTASAQSTIWLVPSTDVAAPNSKYIEADLLAAPRSYDKGGYTVIGGRSLFGIGNNMEVGANIFGTRTSSPYPTELQPNFKYQLFKDDNSGVAAAVGTTLYIPIANRSYGDNFGMAYGVVSKKFGDNGPRITGGVYGLYGRDAGTGSRTGGMFGLEQPITSRVTFAVDHTTGNQQHGGHSATTAGFISALNTNTTLGTGYTWGNTGKGNNAAFVWVGFSF